uniref:ARAD1D34914p n=1 Tax=Blastobotrys adeninivorans TaxID=409370 RepID=A0A060TCB4_BLAAD
MGNISSTEKRRRHSRYKLPKPVGGRTRDVVENLRSRSSDEQGGSAVGDDFGGGELQREAQLLSGGKKITIVNDDLPSTVHMESEENRDAMSVSRVPSGSEVDLVPSSVDSDLSLDKTVRTRITWKGPGTSVYVTGTFTRWKKMVPLPKDEQTNYHTATVHLPMGIQKLQFVVDDEWTHSDDLPKATDSFGQLVNIINVDENGHYLDAKESQDQPFTFALPSQHSHQQMSYDYCTDIPSVFVNPVDAEQFYSEGYCDPPQLPPQLEAVIIDDGRSKFDDTSILPIPNHVVINHMAASTVKNNVIAVATSTRYYNKYVTQILHSPLSLQTAPKDDNNHHTTKDSAKAEKVDRN